MSADYFPRLGDNQLAQECHSMTTTSAREAARALDAGEPSRARELLERALQHLSDLERQLGDERL